MATITQAPARFCKGQYTVVYVPEAASQSFKQGSFVYLVSGLATIVADSGQSIFGMAMNDASGSATTTQTIGVILALPGTIFAANVYHATAASAVTAVTQVGTRYGIEVVGVLHYVDIGETSTIALRVLELDPQDTVGDKYGRVFFNVLPTYSQCSDLAG